MEIKKVEFNQAPSPVEYEGAVVRINFDIEEAAVVVNGLDGEEETRNIVLAHVVRVEHPLTAERIRAAVITAGFDEFKADEVAADTLLKLVQSGEVSGDELALAKQLVIARINQYDVSEAVNQFTYNGMPMWLGRELRQTLRARFADEKEEGEETTTLVYGDTLISLPIDTAIVMIKSLEHYARKSYDQTAIHKALVDSLETVEEVLAYDYTTGYESNPAF